jgi:membrane associated rhomboid family serine protease
MQERQPVFNAPASVVGTLAVLIVIHAVRSSLPEAEGVELLWTLAFVPARYSTVAPAVPGGDIADVTSFVTYMLVHGDATHLVVNSIWMLAFGSAVAKRAGNGRFLLFSLACGIAGALTHLALYFGDMRPVVGASEAISVQRAAGMRFLLICGVQQPENTKGRQAAVSLAVIGGELQEPRLKVNCDL